VLSSISAAGIVVGSTPARIGRMVSLVSARVALDARGSLPLTTAIASANDVKELAAYVKDLLKPSALDQRRVDTEVDRASGLGGCLGRSDHRHRFSP